MDENKIQQFMKTLDLTREEAIELIQEDEKVDKMKVKEAEDDLTAEQKKAIKQIKGNAKSVNAVNAYGKAVKRERKENPTKASIIAELANFLQNDSENAVKDCQITNKERQIAFKVGDDSFELTLVQKRKPKKGA